MTVAPGLLVGLCLVATAYAGGSQAGVKQSESLRSNLHGQDDAHSKAFSCSAGGWPISPVVSWGCPPTSYESFGVISSSYYPNFYRSGLACGYQLKASDDGSIIQLWFGAFDTEYLFDYVTIYDGANSISPRIAALSGTEVNVTVPFYSSGQYMYVLFGTDGTVDRPGWFATFASVRKRAPAYTCSN